LKENAMAYTAKAISKGGRAGRAGLEGGTLALAMSFPKELGGDGNAHNPEQLFAIGYAACFNQAVIVLAKKHGLTLDAVNAAQVGVAVTLNAGDDGFSLAAEITLKVPGMDKSREQALLEDAHQMCPYSKATRGNIPVALTAL
jgi:lipoyl-dependent peroxiredoxin